MKQLLKQLSKDAKHYITHHVWSIGFIVLMIAFVIVTTLFYDFESGPAVVPDKHQRTVWVEKPPVTITETSTVVPSYEPLPSVTMTLPDKKEGHESRDGSTTLPSTSTVKEPSDIFKMDKSE